MPVNNTLPWRPELAHAYDYVMVLTGDGVQEEEIRKRMKLKPYSDEDIDYVFNSLPDYQRQNQQKKSGEVISPWRYVVVIAVVLRLILFIFRMISNHY